MSGRLVTDTTDFYSIEGGDRLQVDKRQYRVIGHAHESQFGIDDPKFWVLRVVDLETKERKIIKLTFFETFVTSLGGVKIKCFRSPEKEASILRLVRNNAYFMQGEDFRDPKGNNIRVLDVVRGKTFLTYIDSFRMKYDIYFTTVLPGLLEKLIGAFEAIRFLHITVSDMAISETIICSLKGKRKTMSGSILTMISRRRKTPLAWTYSGWAPFYLPRSERGFIPHI